MSTLLCPERLADYVAGRIEVADGSVPEVFERGPWASGSPDGEKVWVPSGALASAWTMVWHRHCDALAQLHPRVAATVFADPAYYTHLHCAECGQFYPAEEFTRLL